MNKKLTLAQSSTPTHRESHYSRILRTIGFLTLLFAIFIAGCKKDDYDGEIIGVCPVVVSTDPTDKAVDVLLNKVISATFNTDMEPSTINNTTFIIKQGTSTISGTVAPTANGTTFTFTPNEALLPFTTYTGTITIGATDTLKTAMVENYEWTFTTIPEITLSASPAAGGVTQGAGSFAQGSLTAITATPNTDFTFVNWTEGETVVSSSSSYLVTMAGNRALVANFAPVAPGKVALNLSSNPAAGGVVTGAGSYDPNTPVAITATANAGYTFVNWTENGAVISTSSSFQFNLTGNRTLVANFRVVPAAQFVVTLSSNPAAGGTTTGENSYNAGTSVTISATSNTGYTFTNWTDKVTGAIVSTSATYVFVINANRQLVANFSVNIHSLIVNAVNGTVLKVPNATEYNYGSQVVLTATPAQGYIFSKWSGDATGSVNPLTVVMNSDKNITAEFIALPAVGPAPIDLGSAGDFSILTKSGISTTGVTSIEGDLGVSPATATAITGFGLIMDTNGESSTTPIVTGKVFAATYAAPTPSKMTTAVSDMETAFTTANGLTTPAPIVNLYQGNISGQILPAGLYKWSTGLLVTEQGVTLTGGANDVWVFQIAENLTINNSAKITLLGGAQAKNIFWIVSGEATLGTNTDVSGIILSKTLISLNTGSKFKGKLLAQTAVTLNASTITKP